MERGREGGNGNNPIQVRRTQGIFHACTLAVLQKNMHFAFSILHFNAFCYNQWMAVSSAGTTIIRGTKWSG